MISSSSVRLARPVSGSLSTWSSLSRHAARWARLAASTKAAWMPAQSPGVVLRVVAEDGVRVERAEDAVVQGRRRPAAMPKGTQSWYSETTPIITKKMKCASVTPLHRCTSATEAAIRLSVVAAAWHRAAQPRERPPAPAAPATAASTATAAGCP